MTGIVAVLAAAQPNVIYGAGLYQIQPSGTVDLSPIDVGTLSSRFTGTVSYSYEWVGYLRGVATTSIQLGANCPYQEWIDYVGDPAVPGNWGGGGNSTCSIWTGATAISGYNSGNRTAFIQNGQTSVSFNTVAGANYPMRIQWSTILPFSQDRVIGGFDRFWAESSFAFQINSSSAVAGQIFYNTLTNGF